MSRKRKVIPIPSPGSPYTIQRWKRTRFWAIHRHEELIALCVYRKGAREVVKHLEERDALKRKLDGIDLIRDLVIQPKPRTTGEIACSVLTASP